jgi:hypothetical protein
MRLQPKKKRGGGTNKEGYEPDRGCPCILQLPNSKQKSLVKNAPTRNHHERHKKRQQPQGKTNSRSAKKTRRKSINKMSRKRADYMT